MFDIDFNCFSINNVHSINTTILRRTQKYIDLLLHISTAAQQSSTNSRNSTTAEKLHPLEELVQHVEQEMLHQSSSKMQMDESNAVHTDAMPDKVIEQSAVDIKNESIHSALSRVIADSQGSWIYRHHVQHIHNYLNTVSRELSRAVEETFLQSLLQRNKHNVNVKHSLCDYDIHVQLLPSSVTLKRDKEISLSTHTSSFSSQSMTAAILSQANSRQSQKSKMLRMSNSDLSNSANVFCACVVIRRRDVLERRSHGQDELYKHYMNVAAPGQTLHDALEFWQNVSYSNDYLQFHTKKTKQWPTLSSHAGFRPFRTHDKVTLYSNVNNSSGKSYSIKDEKQVTESASLNVATNTHSLPSQKLSFSEPSSSELMHFPLSTREVEQLTPIDLDDCNSSSLTDAMSALAENDGNSYGSEIDGDDDDSYSIINKHMNRSYSNNIKNDDKNNKCYRRESDTYCNRDRDRRARVIFGSQKNCVNCVTGEETHIWWEQPMQLLTTEKSSITQNTQAVNNQKHVRRTQYSYNKAGKDWNNYIAHSECGLVAVLYVSLQSIVYVAFLNREYSNNDNISKDYVTNDATITKTTSVELEHTQKSRNDQVDDDHANTHILANKDFTMHAWMLPLESDTSFTRGLLKMS